jgi:UDP-glucose 4-epimerase
MVKLILTGASGFVGQHIYQRIKSFEGNTINTIGRSRGDLTQNTSFFERNIDGSTDYSQALLNGDVVIHSAARVHVMDDSSNNPLAHFRAVNTSGTLNLAQQAAAAGIKRFIFISSIKVNGESTALGLPFKPDYTFMPKDPYGLSKYEAEIGLRKVARETGMEVVIIRPPLVYGPGVKANFSAMMKWMNKGLPLPLGGIKENKRSLVSVDNLVDLICCCIEHPNAANQTFLVSDGDDVSTSELLANMATALAAPNRLLHIPSTWFTFATKLLGKPTIAQRLCGSLQVDISKTKELLNWQPPYSSAEGMQKTADAFLKALVENKK